MYFTYSESVAAALLCAVLVVFTLGKSPLFRVDRAGAAIIGAALMNASGVLSLEEAALAIDYRTIAALFSMMVIVANLKLAGFFELIGQLALRRVATKNGLLLAVIFISGALSAVAINDIVCLLLTPVVLLICRRGGCDPVPHLLALAMASNVGSAATFLGNPQNILIGSLSGMRFAAYFAVALPISVVGLALLYFFLRVAFHARLAGPLAPQEQNPVHAHRYLIQKTLATLAAVIAFYAVGFDIAPVSGLGAAFLLLTRRVKPNKIYASIDFNLLVIFAGLFVIVGGIEKSGLLERLHAVLPPEIMRDLPFFALVSIALSNLVSNVPAVLLLQSYIPPEGAAVQWQALALTSTLAGNLTVFGSIANLIVIECAKQRGVDISARAYFAVGFPFTVLLCVLCVLWLTVLQ